MTSVLAAASNVEGVLAPEAVEHWGVIEPMLNRILKQYDVGYTTEDVLTALQLREMQLWRIGDWDAIAVTEIYKTPQFLALMVIFMAGDGMNEWFDDVMELLEQFARAHGCKFVEARGRRGWVRVGKERGYEEMLTICRKEL